MATREILEKIAGERSIDFTVPNTFLPPRFQKISRGHDLIVRLDRSFNIQAVWDGAFTGKRVELSASDVRRLRKEVSRYLIKYRKDFEDFSRFLDKVAEKPLSE